MKGGWDFPSYYTPGEKKEIYIFLSEKKVFKKNHGKMGKVCFLSRS